MQGKTLPLRCTFTSGTNIQNNNNMSLKLVPLSYIHGVLPPFSCLSGTKLMVLVPVSARSVPDKYSQSFLLKSLLFAICHQKKARIRVLVPDKLVPDAINPLLKPTEARFVTLRSGTKSMHSRSTSGIEVALNQKKLVPDKLVR